MFDLKDAASSNSSNVQYQRPGISENVQITKVNLGIANSGSKYLQFETINSNGEVGKSPQMNLKTDVAPGKTVSAWQVTASNLKRYIMATNNVTEEEATEMISGVPNEDALAKKVSALLVGKPFRGKFIGVQTSKGSIIAELGGSESMKVPKEESKLRYDESRDFRPYKGTTQSVDTDKAPTKGDDLPF